MTAVDKIPSQLLTEQRLPQESESLRKRPPPSQLQAEAKIRRVLRGFVTTQLRNSGHVVLAEKLEEETKEILPINGDMKELGDVLRNMADKLSEERSEEFDSMCERLSISQHNARSRFRSAIDELFADEITWKHIVTLVTFTGHVAVHCANLNMEEQSVEVIDEADTFLHHHLLPWILERGGWAEFLKNIQKGEMLTKAFSTLTSAFLWGLTKLLPS